MIPILIFAAFVASVAIYIVVREKINLRIAENSEDKERLLRAVAEALPGESGYQVVYGHYEGAAQPSYERTAAYYYYAFAFDASRIWIMPLSFDKENILPGKPVQIIENTLGVVDVSIINDKEGKARRLGFALYDKNGQSLLNYRVEVNNTKEDRYHHVNIIQKEECDQFSRLIGSIAARVRQDNPGLQEQVHTWEDSMHKAAILGGFGIFMCFLFPPIGIVLNILGLRLAKKGRTGAEYVFCLALCGFGLAFSIIITLLVGGVFIYKFLM